MNTNVALTRSQSLVERTAQRFGVESEKLLTTLKATAFKTNSGVVSNEQMMALLIVSEQHNLNPFTKEIYAYPDKGGGIVPVVGVDGWIRKVQEHPQFDGWEFDYDPKEQAMACTIWRKDRSRPTKIVEYVAECRRETDPWKKSPRRMIRNRAIAQCARVAFGFAGIHEEDEAQAMLFDKPKSGTTAQRVREALQPVERVDDDGVIDVEGFSASKLQSFLDELPALDDEAAALMLDEARTALTDSDYAILLGTYRARFTPEIDDHE